MIELIKEYRRLAAIDDKTAIAALLKANAENEIFQSLVEFREALIPAITNRFSR